MATKNWLGIAKAIAQVTTIQVSGYDAATTYELLINGIVVATAPGTTDADATAAALQSSFGQSTNTSPYKTNLTATAATDTVTITGPAGMPFTITTNVTGGTGTLGTVTEATAATGPAHWDDADNWSPNGVPVSTDDVIIANNTKPILWGLGQSAVTLASLVIDLTFTGEIGLPFHQYTQDAAGATPTGEATEYRQHYLDIGFDACLIGAHNGPGSAAGSGRIKLDNAKAGASTLRVLATAAQGADTALPAIRYLANNAAADIFISSAQGGFGVGVDEPGESPVVGDIRCSDQSGTANVFTGPDATIGSLQMNGGRALLNGSADITSITVNEGRLTLEGAYLVTTLNINGGEVTANNVPASGNALGTININGGEINGNGSMRPRTWSVLNLDEGVAVVDADVVTITTVNQPPSLRTVSVTRA